MDAFQARSRDRRGGLRARGTGRFLVGGALMALALSTAGVFTGCQSVDPTTNSFSPAAVAVSPSSGPPGTAITITGTSFGPMFGGVSFTDRNKTQVSAALIAWKDTEIIAEVPVMPSGVQTATVDVVSSVFAPVASPFAFRVTKAP